ncbi:MAG: peptidoglycan D,D-transpeptidase FtsI family protein [Hydrogenovibrio sp.]
MHLQSNTRIRRDWIIYGLIVLLFSAIFAKAFHVQILEADFLQSEGNKRQIRSLEIPAPRGEIYDRNGKVLALSTPIDSIWVDPKILSFYLDPVQQQAQLLKENLTTQQVAKRKALIDAKYLAYQQMLKLLNVSEETFTRQVLAKKNRRFMYVERGVLPELSAQIEDLDVPGLYVQNQYKRYYPAGEVVGHLIGFTNIDDTGIAGIEKTYDDWLSGHAGKKQIIKDRAGRVIEFVKDIEPAEPGQPLVLSIDEDLQFFLYHALKKAFIRHQAQSIMSVILDAQTGEVLAMVSLPGFNPNDRSQLTGNRLRNRVIADRIEPGSTVKPFIVAKALDLGVLHLDDEIDTRPGSLRIQGQRITDTRNHGVITPGEVIKLSSNVGASKIAFKMTPQQEWQMYHDVGFGQDLGLFLPGETLGFIRPATEWQKIDQASASFGYGFNINLMQLAQAYLIFANEGKIKPVSLLKLNKVPEGTQVVSKESAQAVLGMMEKVAARKGTAPQANIEGYRVAGKTGTVHRTKIGGYEQNKYISLFAGIVPVSNPKYIMVTAINEPSRGIYYGGKVAAPVFHEVMQEALRLNNIPPDEVLEEGAP